MTHEKARPSGPAKRTLPRWLEGYDFGEEMRRELAQSGRIIAFRPAED